MIWTDTDGSESVYSLNHLTEISTYTAQDEVYDSRYTTLCTQGLLDVKHAISIS